MTPRPIEALETIRARRGAVLVIGSANVDGTYYVEALPAPGETVVTERYAQGVGGKGANQAAAAARSGAGVAFLARVGADAAGDFVLRTLADCGVDVSSVRVVPDGTTGNAAIAVDRTGENSILVASGANALLAASDVEEEVVRFAGSVVVVQGEVPPTIIERTAELCSRSGGRLVVNLAPFAPVAVEALREAEVVVVNETEAAALSGHLGLLPEAAADDVRRAARAIADHLGVPVVVTLGAAGSLVASADGLLHMQGVPASRVVDTTGAGDAFVGVLAGGLAVGLALRDAVELATHYAAETVASEGTVGSYPEAATLLAAWRQESISS